MPVETIHYNNGEITVRWQPKLCAHSGICFKGLPAVFDPRRKPCIQLEHADSATIIGQVAKCPSGALSIVDPDEAKSSS